MTSGDMTTLADAMAYAERELDAVIDRYLAVLAAEIRHDHAATGPEDQDALDRPPVPESPWRRLTAEEILMSHETDLLTWRNTTMAMLRDRVVSLSATIASS